MQIAFFFLMIISVGYFVFEVNRHYRYAKLGRPENRSSNPRERWKFLCKRVLLQKKISDYPFFGIFHAFFMWGFLVLALSSLDMAGLGLYHIQIPVIGNNPAYLLIRDIFFVLVMIGVIGCALRRLIHRPDWLNNSIMAYIILLLIFLIVFSELIYFAIQATLGESYLPGTAWLVLAFSRQFNSLNKHTLQTLMELFWWIHFLLIFSFFYIVPRSKHLHILFGFFNIYWHSQEPKGSLLPVQLAENTGQTCGVKTLDDFSWKQLFDALSCVKCGRCSGQCPARQIGELLNPKKINGRLRKYMEQEGHQLLKYRSSHHLMVEQKEQAIKPKILEQKVAGGLFEVEAIWSCTTCGGCLDACPVSIEHTSRIIDMRRYLVSEGDISPEIKQVFEGIEKYGNPWGKERQQNIGNTWASKLGIPTLTEKPDAEFLFFVGCAATYNNSAQKVAIAFAKILQFARIDFAILGEEQWCCGETVRRMGNELLFQKTVKKNITSFSKLGIKKIITTCPHCFNTLKNEYPQFGGYYEVIPHSVFLADLLHLGKLKPAQKQSQIVTYHDPCYLGRYNGFYQEQREILTAIPGVKMVEMPRARERSFCCGAGGGRFWTKAKSENAISINRVQEAFATGADIIITACPYCRNIFQEEIQRRERDKDVIVLDIAEFLGYY